MNNFLTYLFGTICIFFYLFIAYACGVLLAESDKRKKTIFYKCLIVIAALVWPLTLGVKYLGEWVLKGID
jgi:hypothetical protein